MPRIKHSYLNRQITSHPIVYYLIENGHNRFVFCCIQWLILPYFIVVGKPDLHQRSEISVE